tara:strand:+ start:413 stop:562 length:150 start_codon:yes stop_codon:yes gene_type:complete
MELFYNMKPVKNRTAGKFVKNPPKKKITKKTRKRNLARWHVERRVSGLV